ncbi:MAG: FHA domain-containing protein [Deltaproteobacteria bacterium]|nr:MAG: FHA domain-containing protein [Deltaproteobacteria bacterium]
MSANKDKTHVSFKKEKLNLPKSKRASVLILSGPEIGKKQRLTTNPSVLGRDKMADFVIANATVSRRHALIGYQNGKYILKDLKSTHGTFFRKSRIDELVINHGDKFQMGNCLAQFVIEDEKEETQVRK